MNGREPTGERKVKKALVVVGVLLLAAAGGGYFLVEDLRRYAETPAAPGAADRVVTIRPGQGLSSVARDLDRQGIITRPAKFRLIARHLGQDTHVKAGEYLLSPSLSPRQVLDKLVSGSVRLHRLTVPEGYTLAQITESVVRDGLAGEAAFKTALEDPELQARHGI